MNNGESAHLTVLLEEAVDHLLWDENGIYVDGTFGRGGHSQLVLNRLSEQGKLFGIDKDLEAVAWAQQQFKHDKRFQIQQGSFTQLKEIVARNGLMNRVSGVLLDLGVSSPQLDEAERGFSFMRDGELDMRMDASSGQSAAQWIAAVKEEDLARVLKEYGDEKFARRIARAIVAARLSSPITRTQQLAEIIATAHPAWEPGKHPATKSFLAIRLFINRELEDLSALLEQVVDVLAPKGRLVIISFHSLEDRIVKRFIRGKSQGPQLPRRLPIQDSAIDKQMKSLGKPIRATAEEVKANPRARSAIMRVAEKLASNG